MYVFISFTIGLIIGASIAMLLFRTGYSGKLMVYDIEDEDKPYIFLELEENVCDVREKPYITLQVSNDPNYRNARK